MITKIQIDMRTKWGGADQQDVSYMIAGDNCVEVYQLNKKNETMHHLVDSNPVVGDSKYRYYTMKLFTLRPYKLYLTILSDELVLSHRSYTLEDIEAEAKFDVELSNRIDPDYDQTVLVDKNDLYSYFMHSIVNVAYGSLMDSAYKNHKMTLIKDEECPVLKVPLDENARKFMKCGHFISSEAYRKMRTNESIKCPLCRTEHEIAECTQNF